MKTFQTILTVCTLCLMAWSVNAQDYGQNPISQGRGVRYDIQPRNLDIPPTYNPPLNPPPGDITKDRKVFWVHGHGGGIGSWDRAAAATQNAQIPPVPAYPPRKVVSHKMDYSGSHNAISAAGSDLKTQIENLTAIQPANEKARNIVIAHSMGGLVSQYVDYLYDTESDANRSFYGLVTVGTPNAGAILSQNAYPYSGSKAETFAFDACDKLVAGPAEEAIQNSFILRVTSLFLNEDKLVNDFCQFLTGDLPTLLLKDFSTPIAGDLKPGSPIVNTLNGHQPDVTKRVAFYADLSNEDLIWKTMHYMKNPPNSEAPFAANNTYPTISNMNNNRDKYIQKAEDWDETADNLHAAALAVIWNPSLYAQFIVMRNAARDIRDDYQKGVDWWYSVNDKWRVLMGDLTMLPNPQNLWDCECTDYNIETHQSTGPYPTMGIGGQCYSSSFAYPISQTCNRITTYSLQDAGSDGIVPASSAVALPGATKVVLMAEDSHFQMVNSPRLKGALSSLWSGDIDPFFNTSER